jgi:hypothetical protein
MDEPRILVFRGDSGEARRVTDAWVYGRPFYHDGARHRVTAFHPVVRDGNAMIVTELTLDPQVDTSECQSSSRSEGRA